MTALRICIAAAALIGLLPMPAAAECFAWPVESVYDGDTLRATVEGQSTRIRIIGLDTPELPGTTNALPRRNKAMWPGTGCGRS